MDILGVGPLELLLIIFIALVIIGPRDMEKYARKAGRSLNRLFKSDAWRTLTQASRNLRTLPNRLAREAALEELNEVRRTIETTKNDVATDLNSLDQSLKAWTTPINKDDSTPNEPQAPSGNQTDDEATT